MERFKPFLYLVLVLLLVALCQGCAGYRNATLDTTKQGVTNHSDFNGSLFGRSINPGELAQANLTNAMADSIRGRGSSSSGFSNRQMVIGVVQNMSRCRSMEFINLETTGTTWVGPMKSVNVVTFGRPNELHVRYDGNDGFDRIRIEPGKRNFNGQEYDWGKWVVD